MLAAQVLPKDRSSGWSTIRCRSLLAPPTRILPGGSTSPGRPCTKAGRRWLECAETAPGRVGVSQPEAPGSRPPDTWHGSEPHSESPVEVVGQRVQGRVDGTFSFALGLWFVAETGLWLTTVVWMATRGVGWFRRTTVQRWIERATGAVLMGFGLRLATEP